MPEAPGPKVDASPAALLTLAASLAGVIVLFGLARSIPRTLAALAVATLLGLGINPAVSAIERRLHLSRGAAIAAALVALSAAIGGIAVALLPSAVKEVRDLDRNLPNAVAQLADLPIVGDEVARADLPAKIERVVDELPRRLTGEDTPVVRIGLRAVDGAVAVAVTLLLAITLALDGRRLAQLVLHATPEHHRARVERIGDLGYRAIGKYMTGSLTVAVFAGLFILVVGLVLRVPLAPLLALWVMVWDLVPQIGGAAGGIPFVVFALTQGAVTGLIAAALFVVYLQIENNLLSPLLVGNAIKLSPPATMTAALIGVSAGGVVGALLAVPLAGAAKAVYFEMRPPLTPTTARRTP